MYGGGSEFDGSAAAFMGGGFMPSQSTAAHVPDTFSLSKNREARCLLPLTVKQISNLTSNDESNFVVDGVEVNNVTVVGRVCRIEDKATEYTFLVNDGTGQIDCSKWVQELMDTEELGRIAVGMYVRVHGLLRGMQGRRFINAFSIRPVTDFNEIPSHFIECIYVHFYNSRLRGVAAQSQMANPTMTTPSKGYQSALLNQPSVYGSTDGVNNIGQMILNILHQPMYLNSEDGAHRTAIAQQLNIPLDKLELELQSLVENGFIYSTIDDEHYKSIGSA